MDKWHERALSGSAYFNSKDKRKDITSKSIIEMFRRIA